MSGECMLDVSPRINIKVDKKKNSTKSYWNRVSYLLKKNTTCTFIAILVFFLLGIFILRNKPIYKKPHKLFKNNNTILSHQAKLIPDLVPADTFLDWSLLNTTTPKAAFVVIAQESDLYRISSTMTSIQRHFKEHSKYPWIIIGDRLFSKRFRYWVSNTSHSPVYFGQAPLIEWKEPYWIDIKKAEEKMKHLVKNYDINKSESMSWRRMSRYNMGFLAHHPLLKDLEYYWKVQPGSHYHCDINVDPFVSMKHHGHKLSFSVSLMENKPNMEEFKRTVDKFITENQHLVQPVEKSIFRSLLTNEHRHEPIDPDSPYSGDLSTCLIYNNFAIYSLDFLRSEAYTKYFEALDQAGGFFYHKWGDALPQTIAAALFLDKKEISFYDVVGYTYGMASSCPSNLDQFSDLKCTCTANDYRVRNMEICSPLIMNAIL